MIETPTRSKWIFPNSTTEYEGHLSPSQVTSYLRCGECYRLSRIEKLARPLAIYLPIGSAIHKALETARRSIVENGGVNVVLDEVAGDWFDKETSQPTDPEDGAPLAEVDLKSFASLGAAKDQVVALTRFGVPKILALDKQRGKYAGIEVNLLELGASPYPFRMEGRMDVLYADWLADGKPENATIMADAKTSKDQEPPDEYTAIAQTIYKEHLRPDCLVIADVIDKRKHPEVKSYPLIVDAYALELTHRTVMQVANNISAGIFLPTPNWACDFVHGFGEFQVAVSGFAE